MKKLFIFFLLLPLESAVVGSYAQSVMVSQASAEIISLEEACKEYKIGPLPSIQDTLRVIDSLAIAKAAKIPPFEIKVGMEEKLIRANCGYPEKEIICAGNPLKKKVIYPDKTVWINNGQVEIVIKKAVPPTAK